MSDYLVNPINILPSSWDSGQHVDTKMDEYSEMIQTAIDPPALETLTFASFGTISRSNNKKAHLQ